MSSLRTDLANMPLGLRGTVAAIHGGQGVTRRLDAMGIRPGVAVTKVSGQPFGGPVVVQIGNSRIAVGFGMAGKIVVEPDAQQEKP